MVTIIAYMWARPKFNGHSTVCHLALPARGRTMVKQVRHRLRGHSLSDADPVLA